MSGPPQHHDPLAPLSKRERMIAERFAQGLTHRQIGDQLFIAPSTVRTHIAAIYRKLEINNKAGLVSLIIRRGGADAGSRTTRAPAAAEEWAATSDAEPIHASPREGPQASIAPTRFGMPSCPEPCLPDSGGSQIAIVTAGTTKRESRERQPRWRWTAAATIVAVSVAAASLALPWTEPWQRSLQPADTPPLRDKPSVAVLPFNNLSADADDEYFVDGLTDDLITDLSKVSGLFVIARNSAFTYKDQAVHIREVAEQLGVRYVLEGSVRRAGGRIRINAQLIEGSTGRHVWADRYDRDYAEIFTLQDQVIAHIVEALEVELSKTEQTQVARLPTENLEAYDAYLRAEGLIYRSDATSVAAALDLYEKAIALDRNFADAYAGYARVAADVLAYSYADALPAAVARKRAYEAASRALALNPELSRGYSVLALLQMVDGEHEQAVASARKAVELGPNSAEAHLNLAVVLTYAGQRDEALRTMGSVLRLNPKPPSYVHDYYGLVLYMNHRYAESVAALDRKAEDAKSDLALQTLAAANTRLGQLDEAQAAIGSLLKRYPEDSIAAYRLIYGYHARKEDLAHRLEPLRLAGLPDWPYGFHADPENQLRGNAIDTLTFGRTWVGELAITGIGPFMRYTDHDGSFVERGPNHQVVGTAFRDGDLLCLQTPSFFMGRRYCGPLYHNPTGTPENQDEYSFVSASGLRRFTTKP